MSENDWIAVGIYGEVAITLIQLIHAPQIMNPLDFIDPMPSDSSATLGTNVKSSAPILEKLQEQLDHQYVLCPSQQIQTVGTEDIQA